MKPIAPPEQNPGNTRTTSLTAEPIKHDKLIEAMLEQTEDYVSQPCPLQCSPPDATPDWSMYPLYDIDPDAYGLLEQCDQLQLRLEGDILAPASKCSPFTVDACRNVQGKLVTLLDLSESILKSKIQALQLHLDITAEMFKQFAATTGPDATHGGVLATLPASVVKLLNDSVATLPKTASPVEAYAQVSRQWVALEKAVAAETLSTMSLKLQVMRLGFYQAAGQYLSEQAGLILRDHLVDEEWVERGDVHAGKVVLESCTTEPFLSRWPSGARTVVKVGEIAGDANAE